MLVETPASADIRILHVEDDDDDALLVTRALKRLPHAVHLRRAVHGAAAVDLLSTAGQASVDLIILDLNMPVMDGTEFLAWLRREPVVDEIPVVVLTTVSDRAQLEDLCRRGANAALTKDMTDSDVKDLLQVITDLWFHGTVTTLERQLMFHPDPGVDARV